MTKKPLISIVAKVFSLNASYTATPEALAKIVARKAAALKTLQDLTKQEEEMTLALKGDVAFEQILPGKDNKVLHEQLLANEQVHKLDSTEELVSQRIGDTTANKRCFARVNRNGKKPVVTTGIFTALIDITPENGKDTAYGDIPGNINAVKDLPVETFDIGDGNKTVAAILYTISNDGRDSWDKGGRPLAGGVYQYLKAEAEERGYNLIISTLSPIRDFSKWLNEKEGFQGFWNEENKTADPNFMKRLNDPDGQAIIEKMVMEYLLETKDPVMNFHLGNGAYIGDIKINPDNPQDWIMMNYVYPDDENQLGNNREFYLKSKTRTLAPHLYAIVANNPLLAPSARCLVSSEGANRSTDYIKTLG